MELKIGPKHEAVILSLAAKIRGSRGGKNVTQKRIKAIRRGLKRARKAQMPQAA